MEKVSKKEIKTILMINDKADYTNADKMMQLYKLSVEKGMFSSEDGIKFRERILAVANGESTPNTCTYCNAELTDKTGIICDNCIDRLNNPPDEIKVVETVTKKPEEESFDMDIQDAEEYIPATMYVPEKEVPAIWRFLSTKIVWIIAALLIVAAVIYIFVSQSTKIDISEYEHGINLEYYLGKDTEELNKALGNGVALMDGDIIYYENSCVSMMVGSTGTIQYLDIDGEGNIDASLMHLYPGLNKAQAKKIINAYKDKRCIADTDNTWTYYLKYEKEDNREIKLDVTFENDVIKMLSCQIVAK